MCLQALAYWKTILALLFECLSEGGGSLATVMEGGGKRLLRIHPTKTTAK